MDIDFSTAVKKALKQLTGTFGVAILHTDNPNTIYGARRSSPLIAGIGKGKCYITSDTQALPNEVREVIYLEDDQLIILTKDDFNVYTLDTDRAVYHGVNHKKLKIRNTKVEIGDHSCYMEKEIREQPIAIRNCLRGRLADRYSSIKFGDLEKIKGVKRVLFIACGTAYHAGLVGKHYMEDIAGIPASIEIASEYNCKNLPLEKGTLAIAISQSGETLDTINAIKDLKAKKVKTIAITNTVGSTLSRIVDAGIYQYAGPEVAVASTKSFTSQLTILLMLSIYLGKLTKSEARRHIQLLRQLPDMVSETIEMVNDISRKLGFTRVMSTSFNFLGRQALYPVALEGALKLKELAYIHAHGYPAGELKHGPLATIGRGIPSFYLAGQVHLEEKNTSNLKEICSRHGTIILIKQKMQAFPEDVYDEVINIPDCPDILLPILSVIPLQLFSMYSAQARKLNVDKPRNLAKSVTVE
jgi:glucosamine--fructose-6-phosphate aminotransferase (isomerizing)